MRKILVIAMVAFSSIVFGADRGNEFDVDFSTINQSSISVSLKKEFKDKVTIKVLSADRRLTIHAETIKKTTEFKKRYDFSSLKNDNYIISVSNGYYVYEKTIKIDEAGITEKFGASIRGVEEGKIEVKLFKDISKIKTIKLIDEEGVVLFQTGRVRKRAYQFDISQLPRGYYNLEVVSSETTVSKQIQKR